MINEDARIPHRAPAARPGGRRRNTRRRGHPRRPLAGADAWPRGARETNCWPSPKRRPPATSTGPSNTTPASIPADASDSRTARFGATDTGGSDRRHVPFSRDCHAQPVDTPRPHRLHYTAALDQLRTELGDLVGQARQILVDATATAVGTTAAARDAAPIHKAVRQVVGRSEDLNDALVDLLALQSPVAGDLRLVVAGLRIATAVERMAELADHVATTAEMRAPGPVVPQTLRPIVERLGTECAAVADLLAAAIASGSASDASRLRPADDRVDDLHHELMSAISAPDWPYGTGTAVDLTLLARYYERFGDQAVGAAARISLIHPAT